VASLEDVLKDFDRRLSSIEKILNQQESRTPSIQASADASNDAAEVPFVLYTGVTPPEGASNKIAKFDSAKLDSSSVLGIIGIVFVILAGVFFIKITMDSGWLTPARQVLLAAGTGLALFFAPHFVPKAEKGYGALLAGAGTTNLHLTWLGAYSFHHILSAKAALVCATLVGVFSILSNLHSGNRIYLLVAMAGTYLSAPLVGYNVGDLSVLGIFLVIWNICFSVAAFAKQRRDLIFIASYYAILTVLILSYKASNSDQLSDLLVLQLIQFVIFSSALLSFSVYHNNPLTSEEGVALFPLLLLFYISSGYLVKTINPALAPWFGVALGAIILGIYFFAQKLMSKELKSRPALLSIGATALVHSLYFQLLPGSLRPLVGWVIGVAVMLIWRKSERARTEFNFFLLIFFSTFFYGAVSTIVSDDFGQSVFFYNWIYGLVAVIAAVGFSNSRGSESALAKYAPYLLAFGHIEVMLGLYRFAERIAWSGVLFVTLSWGLYAAVVLTVSYLRRDRILGNSALTILLAVSLKAFFYDVSSTTNLVRVACLLAEGLLLYACGWIFKKMQAWA
jgi:uncharacterized membrane protein